MAHMSNKVFPVVVIFAFLIGFSVLYRASDTPKQSAQPARPAQQAQAQYDPCAELYKEWDAASKLHKLYGDHAATQADIDLAGGLWRTCFKAHDIERNPQLYR
jgi:hypothetical protein